MTYRQYNRKTLINQEKKSTFQSLVCRRCEISIVLNGHTETPGSLFITRTLTVFPSNLRTRRLQRFSGRHRQSPLQTAVLLVQIRHVLRPARTIMLLRTFDPCCQTIFRKRKPFGMRTMIPYICRDTLPDSVHSRLIITRDRCLFRHLQYL